MKLWGPLHLASAREVYEVLVRPPPDPESYRAWLALLAIKPPVWGCFGRTRRARRLTSGLRLWTWDAHAVVLSGPVVRPPAGVFYSSWTALAHSKAA